MSQKFPIRFTGLKETAFPAKPLFLAVGMFDGVHLGHQAVIETAVQSAQAANGVSGVLTFWPHASRLFNPSDPVKMIMTPEIKAGALGAHDIEYMIQQPFNNEFSAIEAKDFIAHLKHQLPHLQSIHVGSNWRFGNKRLGDIAMLVELGRAAGVHVINVERVFYDGEAISSTRIRKHLALGEMELANALLGDVYFSIGPVVPGKNLGSKIGFPTLNLPWSCELNPPYGVYFVDVKGKKNGKTTLVKAVANFGIRPTVEETNEPVLEIHVLEDFPFIEGDVLKVRWFHFLRPEMKFDSIDSLKAQIGRDVSEALRYWDL
ncbi:MAG: riboflavin biosynthesis protein RibF [Verrucomicrobia bacterium]|nr:riboflavin biosynthesis protein RibF [Verrucomicrobiota bacterium]MDA1067155.1 riboflavin biosynthesis protein RibF [Verrucomicrobiota bacterium]